MWCIYAVQRGRNESWLWLNLALLTYLGFSLQSQPHFILSKWSPLWTNVIIGVKIPGRIHLAVDSLRNGLFWKVRKDRLWLKARLGLIKSSRPLVPTGMFDLRALSEDWASFQLSRLCSCRKQSKTKCTMTQTCTMNMMTMMMTQTPKTNTTKAATINRSWTSTWH